MAEPNTTPVVLFCGGKGTRLGSLSQKIPKPLVPVGGMPVVWHIMKSYAHFGYRNFVLLTGYKADLFDEYFENGTLGGEALGCYPPSESEWSVKCVNTGLETGTSGRLFQARDHVKGSRFLLTYGDGVCSVSVPDLVEFHESKGLTVTMTGVHPPTSFGIVQHDAGTVTAFKEKPKLDVVINGGFFVLEPEVFDSVDEDGAFEVKPLGRLTEAGQLALYTHEGFWQCMDTQKERTELDRMWQSGERPWAPWAKDLAAPTQVAGMLHEQNE